MSGGAFDRNVRGTWKVRRRLIFLTLGFCAGVVVWCLAAGQDTRLAETAVLSAFGLAGMVLGSYVFGAVWDDRMKRDALGGAAFGTTYGHGRNIADAEPNRGLAGPGGLPEES